MCNVYTFILLGIISITLQFDQEAFPNGHIPDIIEFRRYNLDISLSLNQNVNQLQYLLKDCGDIKSTSMSIGKDKDIQISIFYDEVAIDQLVFSDISELSTIDDCIDGILDGDAVLLIDGYNHALKIKSGGYPSAGISSSENEKAYRGSNEGFCDSVKSNTALIRKRIRSASLKVKEQSMGAGNTGVAMLYVDGVARPHVIEMMKNKLNDLNKYLRHHKDILVSDSGIIEQLLSDHPFSVFPLYQTTERPDKAAMALMEGRIIILCDNSPVALILPTFFNSFFKTADDYFVTFYSATLSRIIRYISFFLCITLPAFYIAAIKFHPSFVPLPLLESLYETRLTVPFSVTIETLFMELSFELLREAGIRIPGPLGSTIGIVGGLIIGDAAVSAGIVSPIIVVVVAITALASFAIPVEEFASSLRVIKYMMILLASIFGFFGIISGLFFIATTLCTTTTFGFPYLMQSVARDVYKNPSDGILRFPLRYIKNHKFTNRR